MSIVYRFIAWVLPTPTVETAVRALSKAASLLAAAEAAQLNRLAEIEREQASLEAARSEAAEEAARAKRVAAKLTDLTA